MQLWARLGRFLLLGVIAVGGYLTFQENRKASWFRQETVSLRSTIQNMRVANRDRIWVRSVQQNEDTTSLLYYLPPQRKVELRARTLSSGAMETLLVVPASTTAREGLLQLQTRSSEETGEETIRIFGLSDRPIVVRIPSAEKLITSEFLGHQVVVGEMAHLMEVPPYSPNGRSVLALRLFMGTFAEEEFGLPENHEVALQRWATESKDPAVIRDDVGILSLTYADTEMEDE